MFILKLKKEWVKLYGKKNLYVKGKNCCGLTYTDNFSKARIYKTKNSALLSANYGFKLSKNNGQERYNVIEVSIKIEQIK